jgi:hypothetical protein
VRSGHCLGSRIALAVLVIVAVLVPHGEAAGAATTCHTASTRSLRSGRIVRPGFYSIRSFGGSSLSDDAQIYANRAQGIGGVYAAADHSCTEPELVVRSEPRETAPIVAYVDFCGSELDESGSYLAADEPDLLGELARVSNEDYGLVVDRVRAGWVHVIYAYTSTGDTRAGWVQLVAGRVRYKSYDEQIREKPVWFEQPETIAFFDRPNGSRVPITLPERSGTDMSGYDLKVLDAMADWILVQVTVHAVMDATGVAKAGGLTMTVWVRRFDDRGRYQIAYAAAGC